MVGGKGRTGRRVVDLLGAAGHRVTVASRRPGPARDGIETVPMDLGSGVDAAPLDGMHGVVISVEPPYDPAGADAVMNRGVAALGAAAAGMNVPVVLVSQIYITRAGEHPEMAGIIRARALGEQALRDAGGSYTIVRPGWLTEAPAGGVRLEQGDTGDGRTSRAAVAQAVVAAMASPAAAGKTFELYDDPDAAAPDWDAAFAALAPDVEPPDTG